MDILNKIKQCQRCKGWSDAVLASKAGISHSTLCSLYKRGNEPTLPTLQALCDALDVSMALFFISSDDTPYALSQEQCRLLELWNGLTEGQRQSLFQIMKEYVKL